jgi:CheY-like chemotaxis protein
MFKAIQQAGIRHVLVVDDYEDARELMETILRQAGFSVDLAANGAEAVARAKAHPPDVVFMDLFMPGMDGLEATRLMKADPELCHIPIVAYTAKPSPMDWRTSLFSAVCIKPCTPDEVLTTVRAVLAAA